MQPCLSCSLVRLPYFYRQSAQVLAARIRPVVILDMTLPPTAPTRHPGTASKTRVVVICPYIAEQYGAERPPTGVDPPGRQATSIGGGSGRFVILDAVCWTPADVVGKGPFVEFSRRISTEKSRGSRHSISIRIRLHCILSVHGVQSTAGLVGCGSSRDRPCSPGKKKKKKKKRQLTWPLTSHDDIHCQSRESLPETSLPNSFFLPLVLQNLLLPCTIARSSTLLLPYS